ncbi:MAG: type II toxin-antitoxin system toxin DNA ADP-ribosyl transferase DarT [Brevinematia bacterium]
MKNKEIELFRITHIDNIPHIWQNGITHKNSKSSNYKYINIGDSSLVSAREKKEVRITNGGSILIKTIKLGDYIPFYFGVRMPMLYVIQHGGNSVEKARNPQEIVYIVCNLSEIIKLNIEFYFSDGHATNNLTTFYDKNFIEQIENILDWEAINSQYWGGEENLEIKWKKQAEFLIKGDLPKSVIKRFICYNEESKNKLQNFNINANIIQINPNAYY